MSSLNPDRATLNFLNSFPEAVQKRGEKLQQEGGVSQIFGNHLFIQGRVEDKGNTHRTTLRLQGNRWFGSCTAEDEKASGVAQYATMLERLQRGEDLPESPNEFDDAPVLDLIEEKLDRELDDKEADFVSKVEKRYRRYAIEGEMHDHDMVRLSPRWEINNYEPLELWPVPPGDILEFWNYIAYAFYKKKLPYPEFMNCITDLAAVQKKMSEWEQEREIASWYERIESVNERPPQELPVEVELRIIATMNEARLQAREKVGTEDGAWYSVAEKPEIERLRSLYRDSALRMNASSQILWEEFISYLDRTNDAKLDLDDEEACSIMNRLFRQEALDGYVVNLDENRFKVVDEPLKWQCEDVPGNAGVFGLQLVTKSGRHVSHSVRLLPGREELYQSDETVFPGPPRWLEDTEVMPRYDIPNGVIDSLEGVEFLRKIGATLPPSMKKRVVDLDLYPRFQMRIEQGLTAAETEHLVMDVTALEKKERRTEKLIRSGWDVIEQKPVKGNQLLRFAREKLYPVPDLLHEMGLTFDEKLGEFKSRVTKQFPEKFAEWAEKMPDFVDVIMDGKLKTILADPVSAAIRFEVINQEIDWFDLRVVIDVEGVNLSKTQIRQLVAARGGYVRMDDGTWMRLEIKLDDDQRDAVTRLGLDPFDLSGETHRMHAMQLADPKAAEVFDPKAWKRIKDRAKDIQLESNAEVPDSLDADLRPYQTEGFKFLAYLATNGFGGILADDMGLGKTVQSIAYILWLRDAAIASKSKTPALVVCPKSVLDVWAMETTKFAKHLNVQVLRSRDEFDEQNIKKNVDVLVLNYAQLRVCSEELKTVRWNVVVLDEGQQIKNPDSKAAKGARELEAQNRLVLTGTPIENRLMDMWSLMAFAMPGVLGSRAYFKKRFDKRKDPMSQSRLAARLRPFLLRRTKLQVAKDLPPRTEEEVYSKMEGIQFEMYKAELKRIQKALLGLDSDEAVKKNSFAILQGLMRLRQICCHPGLIDPKYLKEESSKLTSLFYLLDQLREEGHKVLVFSQFVSMLEIIKSQLEVDSRPFNYLTGQTKDRRGEIEKFQTTKDPSVFLLSLKAGGAGLNLTSASYVVLYDPWWNPAVENQAIDRTHRIGQKNKVIAYRLLTRDSVEEKIRVLQHQKTALVTNVLGDEGFASNLGVDDLQFILSHGGELEGEEEEPETE